MDNVSQRESRGAGDAATRARAPPHAARIGKAQVRAEMRLGRRFRRRPSLDVVNSERP
jgi:hypothetical protein